MELSIYEIIRKPRVTIKAFDLNRQLQQLVLDVHPQANKPQIAEALERLFDVRVASVRIVVNKGRRLVVNKGRRRRSGRFVVQGNLRKKAIVSLKAGSAVNLGVDAPVTSQSDGVLDKE